MSRSVGLALCLAPLAVAGAPFRTLAADPVSILPRPGLQAMQALQSETPPAMTPAATMTAPEQKSIGKAALLSALLPGLGEAYAGHTTRAIVSGTAEAAIWASYITFKVQEDLRSDRARDFAINYANAIGNGDEDYYKAVGQSIRAEGPGMWNEYVRRQERDTGEIVGREYTGAEAWAWTSDERFEDYRELRREMLSADENATTALAFAIVNRVVSVVSVMQAVRSDHKKAEQALGLRLESGRAPFEVGRVGLWNRF